MTKDMVKTVLSTLIEDVIVDLVVLRSGDQELRYVNDTVAATIGGKRYEPATFSISPGEVGATDGTTDLTIADIERTLTAFVQNASSRIEVEVSTCALSSPDEPLDGPVSYVVRNAHVVSATDEVTLSLGRSSQLAYNASCHSYSNRLFPGLY